MTSHQLPDVTVQSVSLKSRGVLMAGVDKSGSIWHPLELQDPGLLGPQQGILGSEQHRASRSAGWELHIRGTYLETWYL